MVIKPIRQSNRPDPRLVVHRRCRSIPPFMFGRQSCVRLLFGRVVVRSVFRLESCFRALEPIGKAVKIATNRVGGRLSRPSWCQFLWSHRRNCTFSSLDRPSPPRTSFNRKKVSASLPSRLHSSGYRRFVSAGLIEKRRRRTCSSGQIDNRKKIDFNYGEIAARAPDQRTRPGTPLLWNGTSSWGPAAPDRKSRTNRSKKNQCQRWQPRDTLRSNFQSQIVEKYLPQSNLVRNIIQNNIAQLIPNHFQIFNTRNGAMDSWKIDVWAIGDCLTDGGHPCQISSFEVVTMLQEGRMRFRTLRTPLWLSPGHNWPGRTINWVFGVGREFDRSLANSISQISNDAKRKWDIIK